MIVSGDCLDSKIACNLAYLDPPYFTQRSFGEFDDRWDSMDAYLAYVGMRATHCWDLLLPGGSLVLHCDWHASHYLKVELDRSVGYKNFASEIIWRYRRWPSKTPNFQRVHDTLLRWVKPGAPATFNILYEPLAASTLKQWGAGKQLAVIEGGKRKRSSATVDPSPGVPMGDVWDIGIIAPVSKERTGYPTQKPEKLLERLVLSLTDPGDTVLDAFCGSGTAVAVALRLGRCAVGYDISANAVGVARARCGTKLSAR
jgi:site-specific DNA-methyltransferase (adenine-specific)